MSLQPALLEKTEVVGIALEMICLHQKLGYEFEKIFY
jgi:hypothetical protein